MRRIQITLPLLLLALGAVVAARPASACEKAGQPFVVVVDRTIQVGVSSTYAVGDFTTYTIHCAPPNMPIYWSSTLNGASTGEVNAFYGHYTDAMATGRPPRRALGRWPTSDSGRRRPTSAVWWPRCPSWSRPG